VGLQALVEGVIRVLGLDHHLSGQLAPPRPAANLHELLEQALGGTEIRRKEG
jgi:hypothetical protein